MAILNISSDYQCLFKHPNLTSSLQFIIIYLVFRYIRKRTNWIVPTIEELAYYVTAVRYFHLSSFKGSGNEQRRYFRKHRLDLELAEAQLTKSSRYANWQKSMRNTEKNCLFATWIFERHLTVFGGKGCGQLCDIMAIQRK